MWVVGVAPQTHAAESHASSARYARRELVYKRLQHVPKDRANVVKAVITPRQTRTIVEPATTYVVRRKLAQKASVS